jgi:hypothetical protein
MTVAKNLGDPQELRLNISNANLHITSEQFERLCADNPDLKLELSKDGELIFISPSNITSQSERSGSPVKYDLPELTPEETARRMSAAERFTERKRQFWDSLTAEEKAEHDLQFEELYRSLEESRR